MSETKIEWTDATWNPVRGCVKVSAGCKNCYAETFAERWRGVPGHPYEQGFDLRLVPEKLGEPLKWKTPRRVFVNSMSDLFQDGVPDGFIEKVFAIMALTPQHTYQILTKRPSRMKEYFRDLEFRQEMIGIEAEHISGLDRFVHKNHEPWRQSVHDLTARWRLPFSNVWLGVSVENQATADERIPLLLQTPAAKRFVSYEPALGPVDFLRIPAPGQHWDYLTGEKVTARESKHAPRLDWLIIGGESGPGARPFDIEWARSVVGQCKAAGVACFVKQLGKRPYSDEKPFSVHAKFGIVGGLNLASSKGGDMEEWPEDLRVREFPS